MKVSLLNRVRGVGSWVALVAWVHWCLGGVGQILASVTWVHKILAWVAWVGIWRGWHGWCGSKRQHGQMSCHLIILYRKLQNILYRTLYNCTNRIHQTPQHTYFISCFFNPNETCVGCIFRFIFKFYLFSLTCKNKQKNSERAASEKRQRKKKYSITKTNL